jgi:type II secretory pathway pseudopilin PulG
MRTAFTLIELLVVITVIIVLLALLTPALDRAIYRAELAECAGNQRAIGASVQQYAFNQRRAYPYRNITDRQGGGLTTPTLLASHIVDNSGRPYDIRPPLQGYIQINRQLNDPFVPPVDLERVETVPSTLVFGSYAMYFGWTFTHATRGGPGMHRVGDTWTWDNRQYNVLLGDMELLWNPANITSTHPDLGGGRAPILTSSTIDHEPVPVYLGNGTQSYWVSGTRDRGLLDMNYTYEDGSVRRFDQVEVQDDRHEATPYYSNGSSAATFNIYIPRQ